jgi:hypothetical protein
MCILLVGSFIENGTIPYESQTEKVKANSAQRKHSLAQMGGKDGGTYGTSRHSLGGWLQG